MNTPEMEALRAFLHEVYTLFGCRRDALFEILDAALSASSLETPAHLSLTPTCQRGWGRLYDALNASAVDLPRLETLVASCPLTLKPSATWYAIDASVWPRCDAEPSPERGYYHHKVAIFMANRSSRAGTPPGLSSSPGAAPVGPRRCGSVGSSLARTAMWPQPSRSAPG